MVGLGILDFRFWILDFGFSILDWRLPGYLKVMPSASRAV
jgi:hypothetical protein